jgi:hypothetical protein
MTFLSLKEVLFIEGRIAALLLATFGARRPARFQKNERAIYQLRSNLLIDCVRYGVQVCLKSAFYITPGRTA